MKITAIEAIPYAIPYTKPLRFASCEVHTAEHVLVRVHTDEGLTGVADAPPRPFTYGETQASVTGVIERIFAPSSPVWMSSPASGSTPGCTARWATRPPRRRSTWPCGTPRDSRWGCRPADSSTAGPTGCGSPTCSASTPRSTWPRRPSGITLAEELCPAVDVLGRRRLVRNSPVPFVAEESATTPAEVTRSLLDGAASAISIKTARTGFTHSQRVLFQCEGMGAEVVMGNQIDGRLGTVCTAGFALRGK